MDVLKPGETIKPEVTVLEVKTILNKIYGMTECLVEELKGYDDKNYHVKILNSLSSIHNKYINEDSSIKKTDFIFKITNSLDSKNQDQFEAHKNIMIHLINDGFRCQKPLQNINGDYYMLELLGTKQHMLRLLTYLEGVFLADIELTNDLGYKLGSENAKMNLSLLKFHHKFYDNYKTIWSLTEAHQLKSFLYVIKNEERVKLVEMCIDEFEMKVLKKIDTFEKGVIHGDMNEQNIMVNICEEQCPREKFSIIDFGDSHYSCLVFDLAITITYMILETKNLDIGGYILAGYSRFRKFPYNELKVLKICITTRLCQSLVLGLYTYEQDPSNKYVLGTQDNGWKMLDILAKYDSHELIKKWTQILHDLEAYEEDN